MNPGQPIARVNSEAWFCVQTRSKQEHIAAAQLRRDVKVDVFVPRIRYRRSTRSGPAWVTEALFPNYLFARFDLVARLRHVQAVRGVRGVVHFGARWPAVPESAIEELRAVMGHEEVRVLSPDINPGDSVKVAGGIFQGFSAMVARVAPRRQRVAVLLDFLGRQTAVELDRDHLVQDREVFRTASWD